MNRAPGVYWQLCSESRYQSCLRDGRPGPKSCLRRATNLAVPGENADLNELLFGSELSGLAVVRPVLPCG